MNMFEPVFLCKFYSVLTSVIIHHIHLTAKSFCRMSSCGLYDYSGAWNFYIGTLFGLHRLPFHNISAHIEYFWSHILIMIIGLPAKSGVAGAVFVVVPNVMGIAVYSPRL